MSRFSTSTPPPPRAFMGSNEGLVISAIRKLAAEQRLMAVRDISVEDFRQLFIPAAYRHSLKEAFAIASPLYQDQVLTVEVPMVNPEYRMLTPNDKLLASFKWDRQQAPTGFYVPCDDIKLVRLQPDISDELREKWTYVVDNLGRISWEFGLVAAVFRGLNVNGYCNTPQQMRFVWPAIRHLVDKAGIKLDLSEASARAGDRARVPLEYRDFLVPTMNIVNRTLLIDTASIVEKKEFTLGVGSPSYQVSTTVDTTMTFPGIC